MLEVESADTLRNLYAHLLGRAPSSEEENRWNLAMARGLTRLIHAVDEKWLADMA